MIKNILLLYGSSTGNVESLSFYVAKFLTQLGISCAVKNVAEIKSQFSFDEEHDIILLIASTWGTDTPCLQEDFELFWHKLNKESLTNKYFALIGLGDNYYPSFCASIDILKKDILNQKGCISLDGLKIQDPWEDSTILITEYIHKIINL